MVNGGCKLRNPVEVLVKVHLMYICSSNEIVLKHSLCMYMGTPAISMKVGETLNKLMDNEYCMRDKLFQPAHTFAVS